MQRISADGVARDDDRGEVPGEARGLTICYSVFLLIAVGRVHELVPSLRSLPIAKVAMALAVIQLLVKWRQLPKLPAIGVPLARNAGFLVALAILLTPVSIWPGASVAFLYQELPVLAATVILSFKVSGNWRQLQNVGRMLVVSALLLALSALAGFQGGRASSGTGAYDPNDLAYVLVSVLPIAISFALNSKTTIRRVLNVTLAITLVVATLLTSSRGGFFGLLAVLGFMVLRPIRRPPLQGTTGKMRRIIPSLFGVLVLAAVIWPNLPFDTRARLASVIMLGSDYNMDADNSHSRSNIWRRNANAVLHRPIGFGINSFPMVDIRTGGQFKAAHNSYLEALVELGFVGFVLFVRVYTLSWRILGSVRRALLAAPHNDERDAMLVFARMLQAALLGSAVAGFFLSMAYSSLLWTLVGTTLGCAAAATRLTEIASRSLSSIPTPVTQHSPT